MNYFFKILSLVLLTQCTQIRSQNHFSAQAHRVIVSTDVGGTDFDDYQSLVHLLLYADTLDIEGIISSPYGEGRKAHILEALDAYEMDYPQLQTYSKSYPAADSLRRLVKQGATNIAGLRGYDQSTEGSQWIIDCAMRQDPRPLHLLIWGGIEDLAQALHDAPEILPKLRVFFIGGPNKKWSVNAYQYIAENHADLWIVESNATYRGWFVGGDQSGSWDNHEFVEKYVQDAGALGKYFVSKGDKIKMGDSPSVTRLLHGQPEDPTQESWGGQYVRAWKRPHEIFQRVTTQLDSIEQFGVLELLLPIEVDTVVEPEATMHIDRPIQGEVKNDSMRFLFSPKNPLVYEYSITSNVSSLHQVRGSITAFRPPAKHKDTPSHSLPFWWTDDPSYGEMEDGHIGAKTVNRWRREFLEDFADRLARCDK